MLDAEDIEFARVLAADLEAYGEESHSGTPGRGAKAMATLIAEVEQLRARVAELEALPEGWEKTKVSAIDLGRALQDDDGGFLGREAAAWIDRLIGLVERRKPTA